MWLDLAVCLLAVPPHMHNTAGGDSDSDSAASGSSPSQRSLMSPMGDAPAVHSSPGVPTAFILLASRRTLRLYAVGNVITANRTTLYKTEVDDPLICVAPFVTRDDKAPGLVLLSANGHLQVIRLLLPSTIALALHGSRVCLCACMICRNSLQRTDFCTSCKPGQLHIGVIAKLQQHQILLSLGKHVHTSPRKVLPSLGRSDNCTVMQVLQA